MNESEELYPVVTEKGFGNRFVSVVKDEYIVTLRITSSEYDRLLVRSGKEFKAKPNTFLNRLSFAWAILWSKTIKGDQ